MILDQKKYQELFIEEAKEQLQSLNQTLLALEATGEDPELLNEAFRLVHTVKGAAKILGIDTIGDIAHTTEDIFDNIKNKTIPFSQEMIDILFEAIDHMTKLVNELSNEGEETSDCSDFITRLRDITNSTDNISESQSPSSNGKVESDGDAGTDVNTDSPFDVELNDEQKTAFENAKKNEINAFLISVKLDESCKLKEGRIFQVFRELSTIGDIITSLPKKEEVNEDTDNVQIFLTTASSDSDAENKAKGVSKVKEVIARNIESLDDLKQNKKIENITKTKSKNASLSSSETVRVKSQYLDNLLDLVGELMISEIRVKQIAEDINHKDLKQFLKNNDRLIGEVQDYILRMRMVPIDQIFKRFPRMVRDMSKEMDKAIDFQMEGNDIEIDRSLLDDVSDAVMHLLRNSIDHGIETTKQRKELKKKQTSTLNLKTHREQSNIVIEIIDDGRGIDVKKIVAAAISKGLITKDKANSLDEKEKLELAFLPGLSTAKTVSDVSGRGVGLDVVNEKVRRLGGTVRIESTIGSGTKVVVKLPPSMAIIRAMLLEVNEQKYAIPLENIVETIRIGEEEIHQILNTGIIRLRDEVLPIQNLLVQFGGKLNDEQSQIPVLIVEKDGSRAGLIVNRLIGQQEIVIKNLGRYMRNVGCFSGATILGDGRVAMILDVEAMI
jgi:two-component system chemotaxis sensor kinase CheA